MKNPTILQIIPTLNAGGAERTVLEITESLVTAGARALTVSDGGRLVPELEKLGGEFISLPVSSKNPFTIIRNSFQLNSLIKSNQVDLVHARSRAPAWSAYYATRVAKVPFITTYHSNYTENSAVKKWYNSVMVKGDKVIANSIFIAQLIMDRYDIPENQIITIHRGIDPNKFNRQVVSTERMQSLRQKWEVPIDKKIIINAARLSPRKGQKFVIEAIAKLKEMDELKDFVLIIAGDPQGRDHYVDDLKTLIQKTNLNENVKIVGHCEDMIAAFSLAHLSVVSTIIPEAFGRAAVEAQALECPVVVTDFGAARETVKTKSDSGPDKFTGWRVQPSNAEVMAWAISEALMLSPQERQEIGSRARNYVITHFNLRHMQGRTLQTYDSILGSKLFSKFQAKG